MSVLCNRLEMNAEMITMKIVEDWGTRAERRWTDGRTISGENATIIELDVQCTHKHFPTQTVHLFPVVPNRIVYCTWFIRKPRFPNTSSICDPLSLIKLWTYRGLPNAWLSDTFYKDRISL